MGRGGGELKGKGKWSKRSKKKNHVDGIDFLELKDRQNHKAMNYLLPVVME